MSATRQKKLVRLLTKTPLWLQTWRKNHKNLLQRFIKLSLTSFFVKLLDKRVNYAKKTTIKNKTSFSWTTHKFSAFNFHELWKFNAHEKKTILFTSVSPFVTTPIKHLPRWRSHIFIVEEEKKVFWTSLKVSFKKAKRIFHFANLWLNDGVPFTNTHIHTHRDAKFLITTKAFSAVESLKKYWN